MFYLYLINFKNPTRNWSIFLILKLQQKKFSRFRLVLSFFVFCFLFHPLFILLIWFVSGFSRFSFSVFVAKKNEKTKKRKTRNEHEMLGWLMIRPQSLLVEIWKSYFLLFCTFLHPQKTSSFSIFLNICYFSTLGIIRSFCYLIKRQICQKSVFFNLLKCDIRCENRGKQNQTKFEGKVCSNVKVTNWDFKSLKTLCFSILPCYHFNVFLTFHWKEGRRVEMLVRL